MKNPPSFQFYPQDFLSDLNVQSMTDEQVGKYTKLLCYCWIEDGIKNGNPLVEEWFKKHPILALCFIKKGGKYRNPRLDKERDKQKAWAEKSRRGGEKTQKLRWGDIPKLTRHEREKIARLKGSHTSHEWKALVDFCGNKCVICGTPSTGLIGQKLCKDHITPICIGGSDSITNLQPICRNCNTGKMNSHEDLRPVGWEKCLTIISTKGQPKVKQGSTLPLQSSVFISNKTPPISPHPPKGKIILILNEEPKRWEGITDEDKALWAKTYPGCDVETVLQEMIAYWDGQPPAKRKLNWKATIVNRLKFLQDHGGTKGVLYTTDKPHRSIRADGTREGDE